MAIYSVTGTTDLSIRYLRSIHLAETSGSAGVRIQLKNGDTGGVSYVTLAAAANGSATFTPARPVYFPAGAARLEFVSGAARVIIDAT